MTLTVRQLDRRRRVLDSVIELAGDGGVDAISMKDVSDRSGVALATIYRYFSSKDHLVSAALLDWAEHARQAPAEDVRAILRQAMRAYERQPAFARMLLTAAHSADPNASTCFAEMGRIVNGRLGDAMGDIDPDRRQRVLRVLDAVWYHSLVEWVHGRMDMAAVRDLLDTTVDLLHPAP